MRRESHALQHLQSMCRVAIHNGMCLAGLCFLLDGSIEQNCFCSFVWGDARKHNTRIVFPGKNLKQHFFQKSCIILFLPPLPLFLPIAGTTWASDWWGSRFHCHVHREGAAQEEKEEIQSLGSAVLIHWFHLPGGFHLFRCLNSVPAGP